MAIPVSVPVIPAVIKPDGWGIPVVRPVKVVGIIRARTVPEIVREEPVLLPP